MEQLALVSSHLHVAEKQRDRIVEGLAGEQVERPGEAADQKEVAAIGSGELGVHKLDRS